jgi:symplekin
VRTIAVKFYEMIIISQTYPEPDSVRKENEFSLEEVPLTLKVARPRKLEEEAQLMIEDLMKYHGSAHISSANLMACMGSLTHIAKSRPQFLDRIVTAMEMLHANLPPTLSKSQVNSVRKHLKLQLLAILKHPASHERSGNIKTLLADLGATPQEINKVIFVVPFTIYHSNDAFHSSSHCQALKKLLSIQGDQNGLKILKAAQLLSAEK